MVNWMASSTTGVHEPDRRTVASGRRPRTGRHGRRRRGRVALDQVTSYGWARPGRRGGDPGPAALAAADEAGLPEPVVGGHDRRPAEAELRRELAFRGQARPGRQQAASDGAREGGRELLVERIGTVGPEPQDVGQLGGRDVRGPFQSTCVRLAIGLVIHARMMRHISPMSTQDPADTSVVDRKGRADMALDRSWPASRSPPWSSSSWPSSARWRCATGVDSRPGDRGPRPASLARTRRLTGA